jgi:hypothetical protein
VCRSIPRALRESIPRPQAIGQINLGGPVSQVQSKVSMQPMLFVRELVAEADPETLLSDRSVRAYFELPFPAPSSRDSNSSDAGKCAAK